MPHLGKKKPKKKKPKAIKVRRRLLGSPQFTKASFAESARFNMETLLAGLPRNTQTPPTRAERVGRVAQRFPELDIQLERIDPVQPELGIGAFRVRTDRGLPEIDDRTISLDSIETPQGIVLPPPVVADRPLPNWRQRRVDDPDETTITSGNVSSIGASSGSEVSGFLGSLGGRSLERGIGGKYFASRGGAATAPRR